jgi:hypothetical protein
MEQATEVRATESSKKIFESRPIKDDWRTAQISSIKNRAAVLNDTFSDISITNSETNRMVRNAKDHLEAAVMWATKAVSRQD